MRILDEKTGMLNDERMLSVSKTINATPHNVYRAWTEPELLKRWFAPRPFITSEAELDLCPGGSFKIIMRDPRGKVFETPGVFLEVVPDKRIVFTDAYRRAWIPSEKPFMTVVVSLAEDGGKTQYNAYVYHWNIEDRKSHENMGFDDGWTIASRQLAEVAESLK